MGHENFCTSSKFNPLAPWQVGVSLYFGDTPVHDDPLEDNIFAIPQSSAESSGVTYCEGFQDDPVEDAIFAIPQSSARALGYRIVQNFRMIPLRIIFLRYPEARESSGASYFQRFQDDPLEDDIFAIPQS